MTVKFRSVSTATNTTGTDQTSITINAPASVADGDVLVVVTNGYVADGGLASVEAYGFIPLGIVDDGAAQTTRSRAYKKIASSEPANYTFNFGGAGGAINASIAAFSGGHDVLTWALTANGEDPAFGRDLDAARDSVGWQVYAWRNETAISTVTWDYGAEKHDVGAKSATAIRRGQSGMYYGQPDFDDIVNAGDAMPTGFALASTASTAGAVWNFLIGNEAPDDEPWSDTDGDFAIEVKMDRVELDSTGSVSTLLAGDATPSVVAFAASAETQPASQAADGLGSTNWLDSATAAPQWLRYDLGTATTVKRYRITSAASGSAFGEVLDPMNWTFEGSQDAAAWTVLDTRVNEAFGKRNETREWNVTSPGAYRYYRLNVSSNYGSGSTTGCQLAEFRLSTVSVWEDITVYAQEADKIRITRGLQGASGRSDFSRAYFTLDNTDGRFSLRNPNGAYRGAIQRNSEVRISKAYGTKALQLQGDVGVEGEDMIGDTFRTPVTTVFTVTGDIDIRIDLDLESWHGEQSLCGIAGDTEAGEYGWSMYLDDGGMINLTWRELSETVRLATSTVAVPDAVRQSIRAVVDMDNGASGNTTTFYTCDTFNGTWVQLGAPVVLSGVSDILYVNGALCIGHVTGRAQRGAHGKVYNFELRDAATATVVADIDFTSLPNGSHTYTDSDGNMWITVNNAVVSNRRYRFHGEIAEWPLAWESTGNWVYVDITAAGVQKRLERSSQSGSAMYRHHTRGIISDPGFDFQRSVAKAYWPMEDGKNSFQVASGLPGRPHMEIYGSPVFEEFNEFNESAPILQLNSSKLAGRVVGAEADYVDVRFILAAPNDIAAGGTIVTLLTTGGTSGGIVKIEVKYVSTNVWQIRALDEVGVETDVPDFTVNPIPLITNGELMHVRIIFEQSGADVLVSVDAISTVGEDLGGVSTSFASTELGRCYQVQVNDGSSDHITDTYFGHLAVYGRLSPPFEGPINSWHYERAAARIRRICDEENLEYRMVGATSETTFLGHQNPDSPQAVMSSAAVSDIGYLVDPLDAFGVEYRTGRSLFNQAPRLVLSYEGNELSGELRPVPDESHLVNDQTVRRGEAGSARFRLTEGPLSVNPPPRGVGEYVDEQSFSLAHEGQCVDLASWLVAQGTLDEERYPRIEVALENLRIAASSALIEAILDLDIGQRLDITDTPDFIPPEDIRQIVIGYEETFDNFQHGLKLNTIPERVFETAQYNTHHRFDVAASSMYADATSTDTEVRVATTSGLPWSTDPAAIPFDVTASGERIRVSAVGTLISPNPFFDADATGWAAGSGSVARSTDFVHYYDQAVASLKITPDGVSVFADAVSTASAVGTVTALRQYQASSWVYSPSGHSDISVSVFWRTSAGVFISTSSGTATVVAAGTWTHITATFQAPATASRAEMRVRVGGTPSVGNVTYIYSTRLVRASISDAFTFDSFNRTDSATNLGSTDDGVIQAWTQNSGTWGIQTNTAYISAAAASIATVPGTADFDRLKVTVSSWASGDARLVFRFTDTSNYMRWGGTVAGFATFEIVSGGVVTRTDISSDVLAAGDELSVRCTGSVIELYTNGQLKLLVHDATHLAATRVGMRTSTTAPRFNNFSFSDGATPQTWTVTRAVNGVAVSHPAGTDVRLYQRPYRAL